MPFQPLLSTFQQVYEVSQIIISTALHCQNVYRWFSPFSLHLFFLLYFRSTTMATEQLTMTRDMNRTTTTTVIKYKSKFCFFSSHIVLVINRMTLQLPSALHYHCSHQPHLQLQTAVFSKRAQRPLMFF